MTSMTGMTRMIAPLGTPSFPVPAMLLTLALALSAAAGPAAAADPADDLRCLAPEEARSAGWYAALVEEARGLAADRDRQRAGLTETAVIRDRQADLRRFMTDRRAMSKASRSTLPSSRTASL